MSTQILPLGTFDLPAEWIDQSSYQFTGPTEQRLSVDKLAGQGVHINAPQPVVTARRLRLSQDETLVEYVTNAVALLRGSTAEFSQIDEQPWIHPVLGPRLTVGCVFECAPGQRVQQIQVYMETARPSIIVVFSFAAAASSFELHRATFRAIFDSFAPDDPR